MCGFDGGGKKSAKSLLTAWGAVHISRALAGADRTSGFGGVQKRNWLRVVPAHCWGSLGRFRLFLIVGLDEGTCGRRPACRACQGSGLAVGSEERRGGEEGVSMCGCWG